MCRCPARLSPGHQYPAGCGMSQFDPSSSSSPLWRLLAPQLPLAPAPCGAPQCLAPAPLTCGGCHTAHYCSRDHQRHMWAHHRTSCRPFKLVSSPSVGRHLVATRAIAPGEVILEEPPLTAGPKQYTPPVCLGCHRPAALTGPRSALCFFN